MFTVKHVKANGEEFIVECASFFADRVEGSMTHRFRTFDTPYVSMDYTGLWLGEPMTDSIDCETIYVMNRYGATVATHKFKPLPSIIPGNADVMYGSYEEQSHARTASLAQAAI